MRFSAAFWSTKQRNSLPKNDILDSPVDSKLISSINLKNGFWRIDLGI